MSVVLSRATLARTDPDDLAPTLLAMSAETWERLADLARRHGWPGAAHLEHLSANEARTLAAALESVRLHIATDPAPPGAAMSVLDHFPGEVREALTGVITLAQTGAIDVGRGRGEK